jgi:glycosyltransferase involved in cell wall biosynthesis
MRIVIDAREYTTSTGRYMFRLVQYLEKLDHKHDYVILLKPSDMNAYPLSNPHFTKVECPHKEFTFDEQIGFNKQLKALKPDLVHFGMVQQPVLYKGKSVTTMQDLTTARFRNPSKNPLIFTIKQQIYKWVNKRVAKKADAIITPSEYVKEDVAQYTGIDNNKITVTYEAADPITDKPESIDKLIGSRFIMYIGRPTPHKNLDRLINAFVELQKSKPDLMLVLAGKNDSNYERIKSSVKSRNIANIFFTGFVNDGQLRWLYENCQVYVFPSLSEGFGLPGLEAMAHGAPVASSNSTCLPEIYGNAAHYFNPLSIDSMASSIKDVLDNKSLRAELVKTGKIQVEKYSWERMAKQTLAVYEQVLEV